MAADNTLRVHNSAQATARPAKNAEQALHSVFALLAALSLVACDQKDPSEAKADDGPAASSAENDPSDGPTTDTTDTTPGATTEPPNPTTTPPAETTETEPGPEPTDTTETGGGTSEPPQPSASDSGTSTPSSSEEPPDEDPSISEDEIADYFPLVDGATWTYRHTKVGDADWTEMTTMLAGTGADAGSFVLTDSPDRKQAITTQWWKRVGSAVMRIKREETLDGKLTNQTTYDPGFTRFDTLWTKVGFTQDITYTHVEAEKGMTVTSTREQHFEVLDIDATITIDDTIYEHCLQMARTRPDTMDVGHYWFAKGIGKLKEVDPDSLTTEELVSFDIP